MPYRLDRRHAHLITLCAGGLILSGAFEKASGFWVAHSYTTTSDLFGSRIGTASSKTSAALMLVMAELDRTAEWRGRLKS